MASSQAKDININFLNAQIVAFICFSQVMIFVFSIPRVGYYAVFDGHAGSHASQFAAEKLLDLIIEKFPSGRFYIFISEYF